jgi:mono/diheme cytochrome c family protein
MFRNTILSAALVACALAGAAAVRAEDPAPAAAAPAAPAAAPANADGKPYKVVDGFKVDEFTLTGFRTWRGAACDRCHGANQEGMVGPSLVESLKVLSKEDFITTLTNGRPEKGMPQWKENPQVMDHINQLYAYLKGRSDGAITRSKVVPMEAAQ